MSFRPNKAKNRSPVVPMFHKSTLLALGIVLLGWIPSVEATVALESFDVGVGGLLRAGGWTRFTVTLTADKTPFEGTAVISFGGGEVARPVTIPALGRIRWEEIAYFTSLSAEGTLRLKPDRGEPIRFSLPASPTRTATDFGILALTTRRGLFAFLADRPTANLLPPDDPRTGRVVLREMGTVRDLPTSWLGWSPVDLLVWSGVDPRHRAWTSGRTRALIRWLSVGGTLVLFDDGLATDWERSFLEPYLPLTSLTHTTAQLDGRLLPVVAGKPVSGARVLRRIGRTPLVSVRRIGFGRLVFVGAPYPALSDAFLETELWPLLAKTLPAPPLRAWDLGEGRRRETLLTRLEATTPGRLHITMKTRRLAFAAAIWLTVVLLLGTAIVAVRPRFAWALVLAAVVGATGTPLVLRSRTRVLPAREQGVLRVFPDTREALWLGVLSIPPVEERSVRIPFSTLPYTLPLDPTRDGVRDVANNLDGAGALRSVKPHPLRGTHWQGRAFLPFVGNLSVRRLSPRVFTLTNTTGLLFVRAAILYDEDWAGIFGPFPPGATTTVETAEIPRRRLFWSSLAVPSPLYGYWAREGMLDALLRDGNAVFLGWARSIAVVGEQEHAPNENLLLVIFPLDITR